MDVYYINRDIDVDRNKQFMNIIKNVKQIKSVTRICAIDNTNIHNVKMDMYHKLPKISQWAFNIYLSHVKAILTWYHRSKSEYALIVEDDCNFLWNAIYWEKLFNMVTKFDKNWELLKVHRTYVKGYEYKDSPSGFTYYLDCNKNYGMVGYIVRRSKLGTFLKNIDKLGFKYPNFNRANISMFRKLFDDKTWYTEDFLYNNTFNINKVIKMDMPILCHTYSFISTKYNNASKEHRKNIVCDATAKHHINFNKPPYYDNIVKTLFREIYHDMLP